MNNYGVHIIWETKPTVSDLLEEAESLLAATTAVLNRYDEKDIFTIEVTRFPERW